MTSWVNDLPIRVKAFAASAILLICLTALGGNALFTMNSWAIGLSRLSGSELPEQEQLLALTNRLSAVQLDVFRYVAWSSSGVSDALLEQLHSDVSAEMDMVLVQLKALAERSALTERNALSPVVGKWQDYTKTVKDTIEIARTDPSMGTMMLGGADDEFKRLASDLGKLSETVNQQALSATASLISEAEANRTLLAIGGSLGVLLSLLVTALMGRSIVAPIRAITSAMARVASGNTQVGIAHQERRDEIGQMVRAVSIFRERIERDNELLNEREMELRLQNARFDTALSNMSHGLAMFDTGGGLIVCNKRYAELYQLPPELLMAGTTAKQILQHGIERGLYKTVMPEYMAEPAAAAHEGKAHVSRLEFGDGRHLVISQQPMANGGWVSAHEDVTERRRAEARIEHMARHDALTDLPNRELFKERLGDALAMVRRGEKIAILCLDLDQFKKVNDTLGHPVGDALLKAVSERLRRCARETDTVARLSGDEFAVIQAPIDEVENAAVLAQRIVKALAQPFDLDGQQVVVGTSVGISLSPGDSTDGNQLLKSADTALYRAKSDGRGTYRFFEAGMDERLQARHSLELALRGALAERQFELHYQPLVNVQHRHVTGFEALLRWNHPERGRVSPAEFISLAEDIGVIVPIGEWVIRQACAEAAQWPPSCKIAVNVSGVQFRSRNLVACVMNALAEARLAPDRLELEITESVLLENSEATLATLRQLHALGVRISMDDFGTGYSSLSYLQKFPFNKIKIDRSFIKDLGQPGESGAIIRAVIGLGRSLGMATTAEGVETIEQLKLISAEGCDEAQGYYFSAPKPASEILAFIDQFQQVAA